MFFPKHGPNNLTYIVIDFIAIYLDKLFFHRNNYIFFEIDKIFPLQYRGSKSRIFFDDGDSFLTYFAFFFFLLTDSTDTPTHKSKKKNGVIAH